MISLNLTTAQWIIAVSFCTVTLLSGVRLVYKEGGNFYKFIGVICAIYCTTLFFTMIGLFRKQQEDCNKVPHQAEYQLVSTDSLYRKIN